jgi:hypothetical protein
MLIIGSALLFAIGITLLFVQAIRIAFGLIKLVVLIAAWCVLVCTTVVLAVIVGVQKLAQAVDDYRWRRRYGEVLPLSSRYGGTG